MFKKGWLKKFGWVLWFLVLGAATGSGLIPTGSAAVPVGPLLNNQAPNFTLSNLTAKNIELYQVIKANKVTLINFWGGWCPYCVHELPDLVKLYNQYHQRRVEILAVNVGDSPNQVALLVKENQMTFPVLIDKSNTVSDAYQITGFPTTFIIDQQGKIRVIIIGETNQVTLAAKLEPLLQAENL